jgi:uncharacterized MnhB-related membrane protein
MLFYQITGGVLAIAVLVCAIMAIRAPRLLVSALWLAGTSALVALMMYMLGAPEIAVIELSVGAGLVTVLFVFAINMAGEENLPVLAAIPKPVAWILIILAVLLLGWFTLPTFGFPMNAVSPSPLSPTLWEDRTVDVLLQIVLIFSGVLGILGLLSEGKPQTKEHES